MVINEIHQNGRVPDGCSSGLGVEPLKDHFYSACQNSWKNDGRIPKIEQFCADMGGGQGTIYLE